MNATAIILAAGRGERFDPRIPKPLANLASKPVIAFSLEVLDTHPLIKEIIVVANKSNEEEIKRVVKKYHYHKVVTIVLGGLRRQDSVANALEVINSESELVCIHDAARPFIDRALVSNVIKVAHEYGAAVLGVPVKATIKEADNSLVVQKSLDRNNLWEIQTPQVFKKKLILEAYHKFGDKDVTDDAMLVEMSGEKVHIVPGSYNNLKITTPEDLIAAEIILKTLCRG